MKIFFQSLIVFVTLGLSHASAYAKCCGNENSETCYDSCGNQYSILKTGNQVTILKDAVTLPSPAAKVTGCQWTDKSKILKPNNHSYVIKNGNNTINLDPCHKVTFTEKDDAGQLSTQLCYEFGCS